MLSFTVSFVSQLFTVNFTSRLAPFQHDSSLTHVQYRIQWLIRGQGPSPGHAVPCPAQDEQIIIWFVMVRWGSHWPGLGSCGSQHHSTHSTHHSEYTGFCCCCCCLYLEGRLWWAWERRSWSSVRSLQRWSQSKTQQLADALL